MTAKTPLPKHPLRCASCGDRATTTILLDGFTTPVCLRHYNVWCTPTFDAAPEAGEVRLTEEEREALLVPCDCGHGINDHGDLAGCWDEEPEPCECPRPFTDLLAARVARIVAARVDEAIGAALIVGATRAQPEGTERVEWDRDPLAVGCPECGVNAGHDCTIEVRTGREQHTIRWIEAPRLRRTITEYAPVVGTWETVKEGD